MRTDALRAAVLGPVLIAGRDGGLVEPPGTLAKALVAALALQPGRALSVEGITDAVWGEDAPRNARAALQTLVSRLRAVAADGLVESTASGYRLAVDAGDTDLGRAAGELERARTAAADARALDRAIALWRGEAGADLGDAPVRAELGERSTAARAELIGERARCRLRAGDARSAVLDLRLLVELRPFDESALADYLEALAADGRSREAIAAFADYRTRLRDALGSSPGAALVELNARLLREDEAPASARVRIGLRAAPNQLIGRDRDIEALEALLRQSRLVTVLGAGGLGKTRLAQAIAERSGAPAVIVVELASVRSGEDVVLALASTLGIREISAGQRLADAVTRPDVRTRIVAQLAERPTLLVVDNCEQVVDGAAHWIADLLASAPQLRVLATSRSPLAISSEAVYPLEPLPAGSDDVVPGPAVQLFLERAHAVRPGASLPLAAVEQLCVHLDGLPLAIELAAARVRSMTVEQISSRLGNRFALLAGGDRSAPERHRTLQAVIEWSWNLLDPAQQDALRLLSVFTDGFGAEAAGTITGSAWVENLLDGLISQSLLTVAEEPLTGGLRYRMLETVREFGQAELAAAGQADAAREALFAWATGFAVATGGGVADLSVYRAVTLEQDNLVLVLREAIAAGRPEVVVLVFAVLSLYWTVRSAHSEVFAFAGQIIEATRGYEPDDAHVDATAMSYVMLTATALAVQSPMGVRAFARLRVLVRRHDIRSEELASISEFLLSIPDVPRAERVLERMRASADAGTALLGEMITSQQAENEGRMAEATVAARRAYQLAQQLGDIWRGSMSAMMLAQLSSESADHEDALRWVDRAEEGMRQLQAEEDLTQLEWTRGAALVGSGRAGEARVLFDRMVEEGRLTAEGLEIYSIGEFGLAELARLEGDPDAAVEHYRLAMASFRSPMQRSSPWYTMAIAGFLSAGIADGTLPDDELDLWAARLRTRTVAVRRARPGFVDKPVLGTSALGLSTWLVARPELRERGVELLALAEALHARQDLPALHLDRHIAAAEALAGADAVAAARSAASALSLDEAAERANGLIALSLPPRSDR